MAQPIRVEQPQRDARDERRSRLERAPVEHADAVLAGFEVLQGLHDRGVLELLRGALGGGDAILEIAAEATKTPEAIRGIRNFLIMAKIFGAIDPELLSKFADSIPDLLVDAARAQQAEPPGIWETLRILRSRNLRRGLAVMNSALAAWEKSVVTAKS